MPARSHPRKWNRIGRLEGLAITLLAILVLAGAGIPTLAVAAAADPVASTAPSASPAPSASVLPSAPSPSPAPGAPADPAASPDPAASGAPDPAGAATEAIVAEPTPSPTPPPGAISAAALEGQPYELPDFVGLGPWQASSVSFYGPGFYCISNRVKACLPQAGSFTWPRLTACGVLYTRTVVGVANRSLPCGTLVAFSYRGRTVVAPVIDRGPYVAGRLWDLSGGLCTALRHCFTGPIRWTIVHRAIGPNAPVRIELRRI